MAYFVSLAISENFCQSLMINVIFLIERTPKMLVNAWKLLVYSSFKKKISRTLCWRGRGRGGVHRNPKFPEQPHYKSNTTRMLIMYVCMMYAYMYIYMYVHIYIYAYKIIYVYMYDACIYVHIYVCMMYAYMYIYV